VEKLIFAWLIAHDPTEDNTDPISACAMPSSAKQ
jgi:hypothetical protein